MMKFQLLNAFFCKYEYILYVFVQFNMIVSAVENVWYLLLIF